MRKRLVGLVVAIAIVVVTMPIISVSAKTDIQIGDYIQMGTYFGEPILWRCVDKDGNGPLMLSDKIIDIKAFDAAGENTQGSHGGYYSARLSNGSNNWADSNIRAWLNSNESAGNTTWPCGNAPSYSNEEGFLKSFTSKELQLIKSVSQDSLIGEFEYENMSQYGSAIHEFNTNIQNVVTNANTTAYKEKVADSVFLLDVNQINTVYKNLGDYYIGYPTNIVVEKYGHKDGSLYINKPWRTLLRTPNANQYNNGTLVRAVIETGLVTGNAEAADTLQSGIRPAFYLNMSYAVFKSGLGTIENPYTVEGSGSSTEPIPTVGPFIPSTTPEPEIESHDFEVNKYRAEYLMNNNSGNTMENYYFNLTNTPSHIFFNAGIDSGLYTTTSAWDGITKLADGTESISKIADYTIEKKDLYSAIIFKMFQTSVDYKIVDTIEENSKIDELNLAKDITSIAKNIFNFDVIGSKKISDMTYDEKNELQQASERFFKSKYGTGDFEKYVGIISSGMDYANDIEGYFELLANYINMRQLNDSMKQVMSEMYKTATDNDMKAALSDCIRVMNASDKDFVNQMAMAFAGSAGKGVAQYMLDKMQENSLVMLRLIPMKYAKNILIWKRLSKRRIL